METYTIKHYLTEDGENLFKRWLKGLRDARAKVEVSRRLDRAAYGNFGFHKHLGQGVWELKIDYGLGYRVYYCFDGKTIILLLCGGDKASQTADISRAKECKKDYEARKAENEK